MLKFIPRVTPVLFGLIGFIGGFGPILSAFAAESARLDLNNSKQNIKQNQKTELFDLPIVKFNLYEINYFSDALVDHSSQQQAQLDFRLKKTGPFFVDLHSVVGTFSETRSSYFAVPEAYLGFGSENSNFISFGRKIEQASFADQYFHLGQFNSFFSNDLINYEDQGLTGIQAQYKTQYAGVNAGWDPLYFPNQGPQVHEDNGMISSTNRWAPRPPPKFQFASLNRRIEYAIRDYNISEIVQNPGYFASVFLGPQVKRPWFKMSYAYHPINEIPLSRDTYGSIDFVGHAILSPVVTYQEVKSADFNFDKGIFKSTFSYLEDRPQNKTAEENETLQYLNPMKVYGVYLSADLKSTFNRKFEVSLALADIEGGEIKDLMQNGKDSLFTFSNQRTQFKRPISVGLTSDLFLLNAKPIVANMRWTYDQQYKGSLVSGLLSYEALTHLNLNLGFDVLGVEDEQPADAPNNFLNQNQANDRVYGGLQYVF